MPEMSVSKRLAANVPYFLLTGIFLAVAYAFHTIEEDLLGKGSKQCDCSDVNTGDWVTSMFQMFLCGIYKLNCIFGWHGLVLTFILIGSPLVFLKICAWIK